MTLLILYFCLAVFISFLCSLLEAVMLSVSPAYIAVKVKDGKQSGVLLEKLKKEIDRPLAAILTLNTIANTIGATGVGAQVHQLYGSEIVAVASAVLTLTILIFSEIIPKTLGANHWKSLAGFAAYLTQVLIYITYPFVLLSEFISQMLSGDGHKVTREEMIMTAELGANAGTIEKKESFVIKNLLMLDKLYVSDIMTPRSVIMSLNQDLTISEVMSKYRPIRFSRIPVFSTDLDHVQGMVLRYKLLEASSEDQHDKQIRNLILPIRTIHEQVTVSAALDQFIRQKEHIFLVINEHGMTVGLVSLEDAIETLLGVEIVDELDSVADLRQYALEQWKLRKQKFKRNKD